MKKLLLCMACLAAMSATAQKIDFDFQGKTGNDRYTEAGFLNWPIGSKGVESDVIPNLKEDGTVNYPSPALGSLPEGMEITVSNATAEAPEGFINGLCSVWAKKNVESNSLSKIPGEAVSTIQYDLDGEGKPDQRLNPATPSTLRVTIKGMAPGNHTLLSYHNASDAGFIMYNGAAPMLKIVVNGEEKAHDILQTAYNGSDIQSLDDIASSFISFTAIDGQDVVIDYIAIPVDGSSNNTVYLNGMVFDAVDPNMKVTNMWPNNSNLHVDAPGNSVTLTWVGSPSAASHRVMLGTSEDNLQEVQNSTAESYVATGLSNMNTYYWRVDEVPASGDAVPGDVYSFRINHLAFPGAEGFGRWANGGRGGQVVHVTSLEDDGTEGTLRWALETVTGPRTVVFDVSGIITLTRRITVNEPYVTIAGQTAPGDGIMVRGHQISLHSEGITRFIRLRLGSVINEDKGTGFSCADLQGKQHSIVDHASIEWGTAETFKAAGNYTSNLTVQNTIIAEALTNGMPGEDGFGYGFEAGGEFGSFHHNLMANNYMNNPRIAGGQDATLTWLGQEEYYNNVAYNWQGSAANGSASKVNFVGNYYKAGPATSPETTSLMSINVPKNGSGTMDYYVSSNVLEMNGATTDNPYRISLVTDEDGNPVEGGYEPNISDTPVIDNGAVYESAPAAYVHVLSEAGASLKRDKTDQRIVNDVLNGTASFETSENGMIATVEDSDYDVYENVTRDASFDANQNGIADWFEALTGKSDAQADPDGDGYTNLEDYLNFIAAPYAVVTESTPATFNLADYFVGLSNPQFNVEGVAAEISGSTLTISRGAQAAGIHAAVVTAKSGDVEFARTFNIYLSGESSGIMPVQLREARVQSYQLYNTAGILVLQGEGHGATPSQLGLQGVPSGVYLMKIVDQDGRQRSYSVLKK